jgi:excisionase family DNA binding protein
MTQLITIKEATALAGVSRRTVYNWLQNGRLDFVRTAGGSVRIVTASLFREGNVTVVAEPAPEPLEGY